MIFPVNGAAFLVFHFSTPLRAAQSASPRRSPERVGFIDLGRPGPVAIGRSELPDVSGKDSRAAGSR